MKDLMECCDLCTLITHDQYGGESAECTDDNCTCHKIGTVKDFSPTPDSMEKKCEHTNQCDGCLRGLPTEDDIHRTKDGKIDSYCTKERYVSPTPTDSWENRFDRLFTNEIEYDLITREYVKIKSFISQVRQKAIEDTIKKTCGVLRQIGTVKNDEEMQKVINVIKSLGIDLSE